MADHDEIARREQEWRTLHCAGQQRYRFRFDMRNVGCGWTGKPGSHPCYLGNPKHRDFCTSLATWKVARAPMSVTGVRYYCDAHCPDVPFFGVRPGEATP